MELEEASFLSFITLFLKYPSIIRVRVGYWTNHGYIHLKRAKSTHYNPWIYSNVHLQYKQHAVYKYLIYFALAWILYFFSWRLIHSIWILLPQGVRFWNQIRVVYKVYSLVFAPAFKPSKGYIFDVLVWWSWSWHIAMSMFLFEGLQLLDAIIKRNSFFGYSILPMNLL